MKTTLTAMLLGFAISMTTFSQTNDDFIIRYSGNGSVVLASGETIHGKVDFVLQTPSRITIIPEGQEKSAKYKSDEVKAFTVDNKQYFAIKMKGGDVSIGNTTSFAQIITPVDAKIKVFLFENQQAVLVTKSYYISIPGDETAYGLTDTRFTPLKK
jgi:hypothetical protein